MCKILVAIDAIYRNFDALGKHSRIFANNSVATLFAIVEFQTQCNFKACCTPGVKSQTHICPLFFNQLHFYAGEGTSKLELPVAFGYTKLRYAGTLIHYVTIKPIFIIKLAFLWGSRQLIF